MARVTGVTTDEASQTRTGTAASGPHALGACDPNQALKDKRTRIAELETLLASARMQSRAQEERRRKAEGAVEVLETVVAEQATEIRRLRALPKVDTRP